MVDKETRELETESNVSEEIKIPVRYVFAVLAVVVIIGLFFVLKNVGIETGFATKDIGESEARAKLVNFFETQIPESTFEISSSAKEGNFYIFETLIDGESSPLWITADGKYMAVGIIPLES
ncbi:MAG: hypothetical protein KJ905_03380 [Nanoarchaeota archaeon]|nr:hypothetical protein [Nanoarchaeota archaeon]MBU1501787.1 hypothetical protein [Nanoarchaeota archaeon]MBU2458925.1 hypothetical protein [Nanoarchaeota archaeon]